MEDEGLCESSSDKGQPRLQSARLHGQTDWALSAFCLAFASSTSMFAAPSSHKSAPRDAANRLYRRDPERGRDLHAPPEIEQSGQKRTDPEGHKARHSTRRRAPSTSQGFSYIHRSDDIYMRSTAYAIILPASQERQHAGSYTTDRVGIGCCASLAAANRRARPAKACMR